MVVGLSGAWLRAGCSVAAETDSGRNGSGSNLTTRFGCIPVLQSVSQERRGPSSPGAQCVSEDDRPPGGGVNSNTWGPRYRLYLHNFIFFHFLSLTASPPENSRRGKMSQGIVIGVSLFFSLLRLCCNIIQQTTAATDEYVAVSPDCNSLTQKRNARVYPSSLHYPATATTTPLRQAHPDI